MRFSDIPGNYQAKERLRAMADSGRIPHAILIEGPSGTGKFAMARAFAQYIHCENCTPEGEPCGRCPSCLQHESFNHPDTVFSFPILKTASAAGVCDDLADDWKKFLNDSPFMEFDRWLQVLGNPNGQPVVYSAEALSIARKFSKTSYSTKYRILLFWLPERMQNECANKLLKLIEEPFPDSLLVFVSDNPGEILPTVRSRLQSVSVNRVPAPEIATYLERELGADHVSAMAVAHIADGSLTAARNHMLQSKEYSQFLELFMLLMRAAYKRQVGVLRKWSTDISALGREAEIRFLSYCERMMRENFINNMHIPSLVYMTPAEQAFSTRFSPFINERNVERLLSEFSSARTDIAANANAKIVFFDLAIHVILLLKA